MSKIWPSPLPPFSEFASFDSKDVGTPNSGLNSVVLNPLGSEILLPLNEGVDGKLKSQINTFLEFNKGEGVQHIALRCDDVIEEVEYMKNNGVEFLERPVEEYYDVVEEKVKPWLEEGEFERCKDMGILLDVETSEVGEGLLMQIFTEPFAKGEEGGGMFLEIIERRGCGGEMGCGGFGRGNFGALFKGIEERERKERERQRQEK
ncbi:hypothetical protein TrVE_jg2673 [Triparma verrucosa]|nr:hypothetical protein TrVE_jg2673 [Triparma verrucosa]